MAQITWRGTFRPNAGSRAVIPVFLPMDPKTNDIKTVESMLLSLIVDIFMADLPARNLLPGSSIRVWKVFVTTGVDQASQDALEEAFNLINQKQDGDPIIGAIGPRMNEGCKAVSGILTALEQKAFPIISYGCTDLSFSDKSKHPVSRPPPQWRASPSPSPSLSPGLPNNDRLACLLISWTSACCGAYCRGAYYQGM
jgi:hypothetical protein